MTTGPFHKDGYFYRRPDPDWAIKLRGEDTKDKGDLIFNTLKKIVDDGDTSEWAYCSLLNSFDLLMQGKRWPDRMNQDCDAKTKIGWRIDQLLIWLYLKRKHKFRHQKSITRDPWIMAYVCAYKLNRFQFFDIKPQWWLYRPGVWAWMKYLRKQDRRHLEWYFFWLTFSTSKKEYVQRLHEYIWMTI